jgi:polysaccharide biosynthesis protein PslH
MKLLNSTFIAAHPPMTPTGGGTRTLHFVRAIATDTYCNLFVLFPVEKKRLPDSVLNFCRSIECSKTSFTAKSKGRINGFLNDLRLLIAPWSFPPNELILTAGYFVTSSYAGKNHLRKIYLYFLKHTLCWYSLYLYWKGYSLPAKTLERYKQYKELEPLITKSLETSDIVWIDFSSLLPFFKRIKQEHNSVKIICNAHNIEYKLLERLLTLSKNKLERKWYKCQAAVMKEAELKGFSICNLIITCSEQDKKEIVLNLPNAKVEVIPNGVDINYFTPHSVTSQEPTLLFTGTMSYEPNRDAVEYFIENIFPYVIRTNPTCKFVIAGAHAVEVFKHHLENRNIEIISSPKDMRPIYNIAWIVVVPLRSGSGTRLKILEAMAMEKPLVSTSIGAEGLKVRDGTQLFIADDPEKFAEKINLLILDKNISRTLISVAKKTVLDLYSWEKTSNFFKKLQ